ncbi:MAG: type II toxin-antitoxin system Phd/YefM family antitoxin [Gammaproteobacteria bacterium]
MKVYTYSEARQNLAEILEEARRKGAVHIKRRDGQEFVIAPATAQGSPLDVPGVRLNLTATEIVRAVREGREREPANIQFHRTRQKAAPGKPGR